MKDRILEIINKNPKHYPKIIKKIPELFDWVETHSIIDSEYLPEKIYSAVYQETNICKNGKRKKFTRFSSGFSGCGAANSCACTQENISNNVSLTKQSWTIEQNQDINMRRRKTMLDKYGTEYNSQRSSIKTILSRPKIPIHTHEKLIDFTWLDQEYNIKKRSLTEIADELGVYYSTVGEYCKKLGFIIRPTALRSREESQISDFIQKLKFIVTESDRTVISPKELDLYVPSVRFAIEVNGLYWHSHHPELGVKEDRSRHINKTIKAADSGVTLMHVTDHEWNQKTDIIKSLITSRLGLNERIPARSCRVELVDRDHEQNFLNQYHLQGYVRSSYAVGLFYENQLVMLVTLGVSRYKKTADLELLRMCSKSQITVVGGFSKLLSCIKKTFKGKTIVSYCDLSKGTGIGYDRVGFERIDTTSPGYFWTDGTRIISRFRSQKSQLAKWLPSFDVKLSESVNMFDAGYRRYWDCGNAVYILKT